MIGDREVRGYREFEISRTTCRAGRQKRLTEEEARQRAYLETYDYQVEADIAKVTADTLYEKIEQIKYEIDSLRSILSAYKETYERVTVL